MARKASAGRRSRDGRKRTRRQGKGIARVRYEFGSKVSVTTTHKEGHMKSDGRLARCTLKGTLGDALHAVLCGYGHNIRMILAHLRDLVAMLFAALMAAIANLSAEVRPNYTTTGAAT